VTIGRAFRPGSGGRCAGRGSTAGVENAPRKLFGLHRDRVAVDKEKRARRRPVRFEQTRQQFRRGAGLAGAGRHFDQHLAPPVDDLPAYRLDAGALMQTATAAGNPAVDRDVERTAANIAGGLPAGEIVLAENVSILRKWASWPSSQNQISSPFERKLNGTSIRSALRRTCASPALRLKLVLLASSTASARPWQSNSA
jgi:hypothetical protein